MNIAARFQLRREQLRSALSLEKNDLVLFCANVEPHLGRFVQNHSFLYFTGCEEPGAVLLMKGDGTEVLLVPRYDGIRQQWVASEIVPSHTNPEDFGVDEVAYLGERVRGYALAPFADPATYQHLMQTVKESLGDDGRLFVDGQPTMHTLSYDRRLALEVAMHANLSTDRVFDIHPQVAALRRRKDDVEIKCIEHAIGITAEAQKAAKAAIRAGARECEVQAMLEAEFLKAGCLVPAFPSIIATGVNATILHYIDHTATLKKGEMVVVDIGAQYLGYASDITRTYCVGGDAAMSDRQKELYETVLSCQTYIASVAKPGMWLSNPDKPTQSLQHLTMKFMEDHNLKGAMPHGIGHFMGLDVHDVGDHKQPLAPGDVITIEPGAYLPAEGIGIRIEDDYLLTEDGVRCLSPQIPK
ncbi:MAG: Xaa-Pro peptidase family protein [Candidatus Dependentiae bacterium]|jgi:Xaa-Pro aminopeptidase